MEQGTSARPRPPGRLLTVRACKYDGSVHREWRGRLAQRTDSLVVLDAVFDREIEHPLLGTIAAGTLSREYFWAGRWYNVFCFREPTGELRNYYCNVNLPPRLGREVISFVDLDLDVLVAPDLTYRVLDAEEFEANAARYGYPPAFRASAASALSELASLIERRQFPFGQDEPPLPGAGGARDTGGPAGGGGTDS